MSLVFLSVVREGMSAALPIADRGPADPAVVGKKLDDALGLTVSASIGGTAAQPPLSVRLHGPEAVAGIDEGIVKGTSPPRGAQRADTTLFTSIEFVLPGLPWAFTPLAAFNGRLRPWIALVVLEYVPPDSPVDVSPVARKRLPVVTVPALADLPPIDEIWAWAHAQVVTSDDGIPSDAELDQVVAKPREGTLSRLLHPRRLDAGKHYVACVIPTFEATRVAALGEATATTVPTVDAAWGPTTTFPLRLPVLYFWEFFTGEAGNFEESVSRLRGTRPPAREGRVVDASDPGPSVVADPAATALPLAGALRPEGLTISQYNGPAAARYGQLACTGQVVTAGGVTYPVVDAPLYAGKHVAANTTAAAPVWVRALNTDPRHRAAAALGARIVRDNQEELMASAWDQAGDVEEANRRLRRARLGREASASIVKRHIEPLEDVARLRVLAPGLARMRAPQQQQWTFAGLVRESLLPELSLGAAFTALTRPGGRVAKHLTTAEGLVTGIGEGSIDPDRAATGRQGGLVTLDGLLAVVDAARVSVVGGGSRAPVDVGGIEPTLTGPARATATAVGERRRVTAIRVTDPTGVVGSETRTLRGSFSLPAESPLARITPADLTPTRINALPGTIELLGTGGSIDLTEAHKTALAELFQPVDDTAPTAAPKLVVSDLATNALAAVDPGKTIARAVLAGLRRPDPPAGVDELDDVLAAPSFPAPLAPELIRIAPDMVLPGLEEVPTDRVFAVLSNAAFVQAVLAGANHEMMRELRWRGYPTDERGTTFHRFWRAKEDEIPDLHTVRTGKLGDAISGGVSDVVVVVRSELLSRFQGTQVFAVPAVGQGTATAPDYTKPELPVFRGELAPDVSYFGFAFTASVATGAPGRYLVFQQPVDSPTFGLDASSTVTGFPATASELAWTNVPMTGKFVSPSSPGTVQPFTDNKATWGSTAADQAASTLQQPVRAAIHFRDLLGVTSP